MNGFVNTRLPEQSSCTVRRSGAKRPDAFWLVILLLPPLLIFPNLGANILWQDEAETATLAQRIVQYGYPLADDGRLPLDKYGRSLWAITDQQMTEDGRYVDINDDGIWIWTSWFGNYLTAGSLLIFGALDMLDTLERQTLAARMPFALGAWLTLAVLYVGLLDITRRRALSRMTVLMLMLSVPYILFARQCRSYPFLSMFTFLQVWGYIRLTREQRYGLSLFILGGVGGFYTFFPSMVGVTAAIGVHALLKHTVMRGTESPITWATLFRSCPYRFMIGCVVIAALTIPFFVYTKSWDRNYDGSGVPLESIGRLGASLRAYLVHIHTSVLPLILCVPAVVTLMTTRKRRVLVGVGACVLAVVFYLLVVWKATLETFASLLLLYAATAVAVGVWMLRSRRRCATHDEWLEQDWRQVIAVVVLGTVMAAAALANHPFYRYLFGALPLLTLICAGCVLRMTRGKAVLNVLLLVVLLGSEFFQYGPLYAARRIFFDPVHRRRVAELAEANVRSGVQKPYDEAHDQAYLEATEYGHRNSNGYTWTMLTKNGRWDKFSDRKELEFPLYNLYLELTTDYQGPIEEVIRYLLVHGSESDLVTTVYEHFPLRYYTPFLVLRTRDLIPRYGFAYPDWIVAQHWDYRSGLPRGIVDRTRNQAFYELIDLPGRPPALQWDNIPEPAWHLFEALDRPARLRLFRLRPEVKTGIVKAGASSSTTTNLQTLP